MSTDTTIAVDTTDTTKFILDDLPVRVAHAMAGHFGHTWGCVPIDEILEKGVEPDTLFCTPEKIGEYVRSVSDEGVMGMGETAPWISEKCSSPLKGNVIAHVTGTGSQWWEISCCEILFLSTGIGRPSGEPITYSASVNPKDWETLVGQVTGDGTPFYERHIRTLATNARRLMEAALEAVNAEFGVPILPEHRAEIETRLAELEKLCFDLPGRTDEVADFRRRAEEIRREAARLLDEAVNLDWEADDLIGFLAEKTAPTE